MALLRVHSRVQSPCPVRRLAIVAVLVVITSSIRLILNSPTVFADDPQIHKWPAFRGANATGDGGNADVPIQWNIESGENVLWKTAIPGLGHSSPIVWGRHVFVTTAISSNPDSVYARKTDGRIDRRTDRAKHTWQLYAVDRETGKVVWNRVVTERVPAIGRHPKNSYASATPATEGKHIVVWLGSEGLHCYRLDGTHIWSRDLGVIPAGASYDDTYLWGPASSPIIYKNSVIIQADSTKESSIAAYDLETGKQLWQTRRDVISSFSTPTIYHSATRTSLITNGARSFFAYDPATGKELWRMSGSSLNTTPTPVVGGGLIYVASGYKDVQTIFAIRPGGNGDITPANGALEGPQVAWGLSKGAPYMTTPLFYDGHLYINRRGILSCYVASSGELVFRKRIGGGPFYASPVVAHGRIYLIDELGTAYVVTAGVDCQILATNEMQAPCMATPAIVDDTILIRTLDQLVAISPKRTETKPRSMAEGRQAFRGKPLGSKALPTAAIHLADVDHDHDLDIAIAAGRHWPAQNTIYLNNGQGIFSETRNVGSGHDRTYATPLADLDGDGDLDIAVGNDGDPNRVYLNDGESNFQPGPTFGPPSQNTRNLTLADIDADGDNDILVANRAAPNYFYLNNGKGKFENGRQFGTGSDSTISIAVGDLDGDGDLDLVLANRDGTRNSVLIQQTGLRFSEPVFFGDKNVATRSLALADLNGDHALDIVTANIQSPNEVFLNDGRGHFRAGSTVGQKDGVTYSVAVADMDSDKDIDLIIGNNGQENRVYFNDGSGKFPHHVRFGGANAHTYCVAVGDLNGDGMNDIAVANSGSPDMIYFNVLVRANTTNSVPRK